MAVSASDKSDRAFRTISEASEIVGVPQHVLRFWETRFPQLQPLKRGGNRRYYRPSDMALLETIRAMLHDRGLTIRGAKLALSGEAEAPRLATMPSAAPPAATPRATTAPPGRSATGVSAVPAGGIDFAALRAIRDRLRFALAA